jgi:hypothetical protein
MDTTQSDSASPAVPPASPRFGWVKRVVTSVAASAVLLAGGAAIGIAMTGGASAASKPTPSNQPATPSALAQALCARLALVLGLNRSSPDVAARIEAVCTVPILRLAAVGGIHGEVTFQAATGPRTLAFERGTIASVTGSSIVVKAPDGTTWTWDLVPNVLIRSAGHKVPESTIATGDLVFVAGQVVSGANDARLIMIRPTG